MKKCMLILVFLFCYFNLNFLQAAGENLSSSIVTLPKPQTNGQYSLEEALAKRRSVNQFTEIPLALEQIGQLCWAGQGITDPNRGLRTAPSAGALYPIKLYVLLPDGLFIYDPARHELKLMIGGDLRNAVFNSSFNQRFIQKAPCIFIIAGNPKIIEAKYRNRGEKFTSLEAGHIAENIELQAVTLGLGSIPVGVFDAKTIAQICKMPETYEVFYLMPIGHPVETVNLEPTISTPAAAQQQQGPPQYVDLRTKKVVIIVPNKYFNDYDFYGAQQALLKEDIQPVIASTYIGEIKGMQIMGLQRNIIYSTVLVQNLKAQDFDAIVIVGGSDAGGGYLYNQTIIKLVRDAYAAGKILAAISEAPAFFASANIIKGKNVTSAVSVKYKMTQAGGIWQQNLLAVDGNIITAGQDTAISTNPASAGTQDRFGTAIIGLLKGQKKLTY